MEIYKDLSNPTSREFEKLLNSKLQNPDRRGEDHRGKNK